MVATIGMALCTKMSLNNYMNGMHYLHICQGKVANFPWVIPQPVKGIGMKAICKLGPVVRDIFVKKPQDIQIYTAESRVNTTMSSSGNAINLSIYDINVGDAGIYSFFRTSGSITLPDVTVIVHPIKGMFSNAILHC